MIYHRLFLTVVLFLFFFYCPDKALARLVVVVYDNSGSMDGCPRDDRGRITSNCDNRFAYASYSLQTLRALMGPKDQLSVVFTSSPGIVWYSGGNTIGDIAHIREVTSKPQGNTPHATVEKALNVLKESRDPDRWLVMITDGQFQTQKDVPSLLDSFLAMHSRGLKVLLLGLGDGVNNSIFHIWKEKSGAKIYYAKAADDIRLQMQQIAAIVASSTDRGLQVSAKGNSVSFVPIYPLRRFTLLQQTTHGRSVNPRSAFSGNNPLEVSSSLSTQTPTLNDLYGCVNQVWGRGAILIPAGVPVTVTFDRPVDVTGLTVLPEVDARLDVRLTDETGHQVRRDGAVFNACLEHGIFIEARLLGSSSAPLEGAGATARVDYGGQITQLAWDRRRKAFTGSITVSPGTLPFRVEVVNLGYIYAVDAGQIRARNDCPPREITFLALRNGKPTTTWSENVMALDGKTPFELVPFIDGRPMTKGEAANWKCSADSPTLPVEIRPTGKGGWYITPRERWCTPCLTPTGTFSVRAAVGAVPARNTPRDILLTLTPSRPLTGKDKVIPPRVMTVDIANPGVISRCWKLALYILVGLFLLWWLFGIFKKNRFANGASIKYERGGTNPRAYTEPLRGSFLSRWVFPYKPENRLIEGIFFKAGGSGSYVMVSKESLVKGMRVAGDRIDDVSNPRDLKLCNGEKIQIEGATPKTYTYSN